MATDSSAGSLRRLSVIVPAHNEENNIREIIRAVLAQVTADVELEIIVSDDGSVDGTVAAARAEGARVVELPVNVVPGNPGATRNRGVAESSGDLLLFLDADCTPAPGWLEAHRRCHEGGETIVGGSIDIPEGLPVSARCDHYCGSYHVHPMRPPGVVHSHTPANLSVRREVLLDAGGFAEELPIADGHEELPWQGAAMRAGHRIWFEPAAVVRHRNRPGFGNLLRRNYRWGYSSLESKATTGAARASWLFRRPKLLIAAGPPFAIAHTAYTIGCWARAGVLEPIVLAPAVLLARAAYALGYSVGGARWLARSDGGSGERPRWR